jgi:phospholipid/cholesterol/gamma-HCH transport system permease protein
MQLFQNLGSSTLSTFSKLGRATFFLFHAISGISDTFLRPRLLLKQMYSIGVLTVLIIVISGLFVGMVLGLQGYYILSDFGAEEALGVMVATSLVRELGPVVSALLFA